MNNNFLSFLTDAHCHIIETFVPGKPLEVITQRLLVMGTQPKDWTSVKQIALEFPNRIQPAFGIHPWFAEKVLDIPSALSSLEDYLKEFPTALVGEIGLDGAAKDKETGKKFDMEKQFSVFVKQWDLAVAFQRPVSIHSVQVSGKTVEFLQNMNQLKHSPPSIMLHSFSGSAETAQTLLKLNYIGPKLYFSFSHAVNSRSPKIVNRILAIPQDRILIESDLGELDKVDEAMWSILQVLCDIRQWNTQEATSILEQNMNAYLKG